MSGCKAGLQQGDQGQQFCHYVSFLSLGLSGVWPASHVADVI